MANGLLKSTGQLSGFISTGIQRLRKASKKAIHNPALISARKQAQRLQSKMQRPTK